MGCQSILRSTSSRFTLSTLSFPDLVEEPANPPRETQETEVRGQLTNPAKQYALQVQQCRRHGGFRRLTGKPGCLKNNRTGQER